MKLRSVVGTVLVLLAILVTSVTFGAVNHSATLRWVASTSANISGYNVYRGTTTGGPYAQINMGLVPCCTFQDTVVTAGATYYYVTTAVDNVGAESPFSNQVTAVIPGNPNPPTGLTVVSQ